MIGPEYFPAAREEKAANDGAQEKVVKFANIPKWFVTSLFGGIWVLINCLTY
jgi:hypothetical protein